MELPAALSDILDPAVPIYALSPHIDDVIWSAGGWLLALARQGYDITLVSIFSQTIFVYDEVQPPLEATAIRKGEDYAAAQAAGFRQVIFLDFPDGILRDTPQTQVINPKYQTPAYLLELITRSLKEVLPRQATLLAPAGFGGHMDHLTTRRAAGLLAQPKVLYQDLPYGTRDHNAQEALAFLQEGWQNVQLTLPPELINNHLDLFWQYRSQASQAVADEVKAHLSRRGLQLWVPASL